MEHLHATSRTGIMTFVNRFLLPWNDLAHNKVLPAFHIVIGQRCLINVIMRDFYWFISQMRYNYETSWSSNDFSFSLSFSFFRNSRLETWNSRLSTSCVLVTQTKCFFFLFSYDIDHLKTKAGQKWVTWDFSAHCIMQAIKTNLSINTRSNV